MNKNQYIMIGVVVAIAFAALGFWGGTAYAKSHGARGGAVAGQFQGRFGAQAGGARGGTAGSRMGSFVMGSILSKDATSLTIKTSDGGSKNVLFASSTAVMKAATGTLTDLTAGTEVTVTGTTNSDGSVTASSIQIRPAGIMAPGGRGQ